MVDPISSATTVLFSTSMEDVAQGAIRSPALPTGICAVHAAGRGLLPTGVARYVEAEVGLTGRLITLAAEAGSARSGRGFSLFYLTGSPSIHWHPLDDFKNRYVGDTYS